MPQRVCAILLACLPATVLAQSKGVELKLAQRRIQVGEMVRFQIIFTNTGVPATPEVRSSNGLSIRILNAMPNKNSMTSIINGRRSKKTSYTYTFRLVAKRVGTYALGPFDLTAGGNSYKTAPVTVIVEQPAPVPELRGDRFVYVETQVKPRSVYVTQSVDATLVIGIRKVKIDGRMVQLDLLRKALDFRASSLSVFEGGNAVKSEIWLQGSDGVRNRYEVFKVRVRLRAEEVGPMDIGPVFLAVKYPTALRRGFWGTDISRARRETATAPKITVEVKPAPAFDRPDDFTGAIGRFTMSVRAKPTRLEQGQPVTLTLALRGAKVGGVAGPRLSANPELASRFDFSSDELIGDVERGAMVFRRAIFPKQAGEQTIPSITWSYFDPVSESYQTLSSEPIALVVDPSSNPSQSQFDVTGFAGERGLTELTLLSGGISPNYVDVDSVLANQAIALTPSWMAGLVAPPFAWLCAAVVARNRRRSRADSGFGRRRAAPRSARRRIGAALANGSNDDQLTALALVMTGYVSDRFGLPPGELTPQDVAEVLAMRQVDDTLATEIRSFLESCDTARYAPGAGERVSATQAARQVRKWIQFIERASR